MAKAKAARKRARKSSSASKKSTAKRTSKKRAPAKSGAKKRKTASKKRATRKPRAAKRTAASELLTLTEVSKRTGISMPTLQRYKKEYQSRIPSVGSGRKQRYPAKALPVFQQIKKENLKKRGRPRKAGTAAAASRKTRKPRGGTPEGLLSLSEIGRRTGISYPTLLRYVKLYGDRIPSRGTGRKRRYLPEAVPVFEQLRKESRRGRRKGSGKKTAGGDKAMAVRLRALERQQARLAKQVNALVKALKGPWRSPVRGL